MNPEPCYFYVDTTDPDPTKNRIWPLCLKCGKGRRDTMFWNKGYGQFDIQCKQCDRMIYENSDRNADAR